MPAIANVRAVIAEHAARLRAMNEEVRRTFRLRPGGPQHPPPAKLFLTASILWPSPADCSALSTTKRRDPAAIETASSSCRRPVVLPLRIHQGRFISSSKTRTSERQATNSPGLSCFHEHHSRDATTSRSHGTTGAIGQPPSFLKAVESQARSEDAEIRRRSEHILRVLKSNSVIV